MKLRIERLRGPEALPDIEQEWESINARIFPRTPYTSPLWISLWWRHLRRRGLLSRDEFFCHIVRDANGRLIAVAPLMLSHIPGFGPLGLRRIQFFGADSYITEFRGVICRIEDEYVVIQALMEYFQQHQGRWDVFKWKGLRRRASEYSLSADGAMPDYLLMLPDSWEELRSRLSANMRKNVRKVYKLLERDGHSFVFRLVDQPDDVPAALSRFFSLHTASANASEMNKNRENKFARSRRRDFLIEYASQTAKIGQLRVLELEIDGAVRASRIAFIFGPELYLYYSGYDPSWKKYSIMTLLMSELIKWSIDHRLQLINLSTGKDQSKLRWRPSEIFFHDATQTSPTLQARLSVPVYEALVAQRRRLSVVRTAFGGIWPRLGFPVFQKATVDALRDGDPR